jgi:hypothetical protein
MFKVFCTLIVALLFSSCSSTKVDATYTKAKTETKSVKVESVLSLFKVPVTVCYVLSETEIPFRVDFPLTICRNTVTLSYEAKYDLYKTEKIETHMVSLYIPF